MQELPRDPIVEVGIPSRGEPHIFAFVSSESQPSPQRGNLSFSQGSQSLLQTLRHTVLLWGWQGRVIIPSLQTGSWG